MAPALFESICDGDRQLAIVIRQGSSSSKYNFPTDPKGSLQLGVTFYRDGDVVTPHAHHIRHLASRDCQEFILVQSGELEVSVFRDDGTALAQFILVAGESVLFQNGAHALRCHGDTRILEVKQGPYISPERDKYPVDVPSFWRGDEAKSKGHP